MADLLIALGGTGQHVALAVARLAFLGALPRVTLETIDAEDTTDLSESLTKFGRTSRQGEISASPCSPWRRSRSTHHAPVCHKQRKSSLR